MGRLVAAAGLILWSAWAGAEEVLYRLGGAEPISIGASSRTTTLDLSVAASWNANLMCGDFDASTSIANQLNGITGAFQQVMGNVIDTAQGVVASLPALVIQRLNPGLYDLLQNGVLEAGQEFRVAKLRCDRLTDRMSETLAHEGWAGIARTDHWRRQMGLGGDALAVAEEAEDAGPDAGVPWVAGVAAGGAGQDPIAVGADVAVAGYNQLLSRGVTDATPVSDTACGGSGICMAWADPAEMTRWLGRVVGEVTIRTCEGCVKVEAKAGMGLASEVARQSEALEALLTALVTPPFAVVTEAQLVELRGGSGYSLSPGLIGALRAEPAREAVAGRLAGELATGRVMDQAAMARRALAAGMKEPNVANNAVALETVGTMLDELDAEIRQVETELRVKSLLGGTSATVLLAREAARRRAPSLERQYGSRIREGARQ